MGFFSHQKCTVSFKEQYEQLSFTCCYLEFYTKEVSKNESIKSRHSEVHSLSFYLKPDFKCLESKNNTEKANSIILL